MPTPVTFKHLVAGSTFITAKGKVCRFLGKPGLPGTYETSDTEEIAELDILAASPTVQIERVAEEEAQAAMKKPVDPAIELAAKDAAKPAEAAANPTVVAAQQNLAATIAAAKRA